MKKNKIKLNEDELRKLIADSVKKVLNEGINGENSDSETISIMSDARNAAVGAWVKLYDLIDRANSDETMKFRERLLKADDLFKELVGLLNIW